MPDLADNEFFLQIQGSDHCGIRAAVAQMYQIAAGLKHIGGVFGVEAAHIPQIPCDRDNAAFARREGGCFGEAGQGLAFLHYFAIGSGEVNLQDFPPPVTAGVLHAGAQAHKGALRRDPRHLMAELGVGEAVAEGEGGLCACFIKIAIAHKDPLGIEGVVLFGKARDHVVLIGSPGRSELA